MTTSVKRLCIICGARVRNQNPKTVTCSPDCTAKKNGQPEPEVEFNRCIHCNTAITDKEGNVCNACYAHYTPVMLDEIGDDEP